MPRLPRNFVTDIPYHITQRGNHQQDVFFSADDRRKYLDLLQQYSSRYKLRILAYCLMTNHIHIVGIPRTNTCISRTLQIAHMRYTKYINQKMAWQGHLWHSRFFASALDDAHLWQAVRYVEQNPVRACIVKNAWDYPWSSAAYHCGLRQAPIVTDMAEYRDLFDDWQSFLVEIPDKEVLEFLRRRTKNGIPCGDGKFLKTVSKRSGISFVERKIGRPSILKVRHD